MNRIRLLLVLFGACVLPVAALGEEVLDLSQLGNRGVAWVTQLDESRAVHNPGRVGDVNGDGFDDFAFGVLERLLEDPWESTPVPWGVFLIYGGPRISGEIPLAPDLERTWQVRGGELTTHPWSHRVHHIAPAGDVESDGYDDFFLGFGRYPDNDPGGGRCLLVRGGPELLGATTLEQLLDADGVTVFSTSELGYEWIGDTACSIGDFNGDGEADIGIGAPGSLLDMNGQAREAPGAAFLLFSVRDLPRDVDVARVGSSLPGVRIEGFERWSDVHGRSLGSYVGGPWGLGDFNGDGLSDVLLKSTSADPDSIFIVLGHRDPQPVIRLGDAASNPHVIEMRGPTRSETVFGSIAPLGDVNGDGLADLGYSRYDWCCQLLSPPREGWVQVLFGSPDFPMEVDFDAFDPGLGVRIEEIEISTRFGGMVSPAGDFDGDGRPDVILGASDADPEGREDAGEAYILLSRDGFAAPAVLRGDYPGLRLLGAGAGDSVGGTATPAGDFDGDGYDDILLIGYSSAENSEHPGLPRCYLIYGGPETGAPLAPLGLVSVEPGHGTKEGGTVVTLRGTGFRGAPRVAFGAFLAPSVTVVKSTELRVVTPPSETTGPVDVTVAIDGESATLPGGFEYSELPAVDLDDLAGRGFTLRESEADDSLGLSVAFGDITGDGNDELIVAGVRSERFAVSILRGGADLPSTHTAFEASPHLSVITALDARLSFAEQVAVPGDVNGDGVDDLLLGAGNGQAFLVFGREDWPEEVILEDETFFFRAVRLTLDDRITSRVKFSGTGDLTGDGFDDFAAGFVTSITVQGEAREEAELVFVEGRENWPEDFELDLPAFVRSRFHIAPRAPGFRWLVTPAGDVSGDGLEDVLATIPAAGGAPGAVYLIYGSGDLPREAELDAFVEAGGGTRFEVEETTGGSLRAGTAGDVNGDGFSDVVISYEGTVEAFESLTFLVAGGAELAPSITLSGTADDRAGVLRLVGGGVRTAYWNAATAGDFNADGFDDVLVGRASVGEPPAITLSASASLVLGGARFFEPPRAIDLKSLGARGLEFEARAASTMVLPADTSGDVNGDGRPDFALLFQAVVDRDVGLIQQDTVYVIYGVAGDEPEDGLFLRGDSNSDGSVNLTDGVFTLTHLFAGGDAPACEDAADSDDDGVVQLTDAIYLFGHLFAGGPEPPPPFSAPGRDPTEDELGCTEP